VIDEAIGVVLIGVLVIGVLVIEVLLNDVLPSAGVAKYGVCEVVWEDGTEALAPSCIVGSVCEV